MLRLLRTRRNGGFRTTSGRFADLALDRELLEADAAGQRGSVIREVARARTLTALAGMDGPRKRFVITFLYELSLINGHDQLISLATADLEEADLSGAELFGANLDHARLHACQPGARADLGERVATRGRWGGGCVWRGRSRCIRGFASGTPHEPYTDGQHDTECGARGEP